MTKSLAARALCAIAGLAIVASGANAAMISFIYTGSASGSLGGNAFGNSTFTIRAFADTASVVSTGTGWRVLHLFPTTIEVSSLGFSLTLLTATTSAVNSNSDSVIFGNNPADLALQILGTNPAFNTWDMQSSIGPFDLASETLQWTTGFLATDGGFLVLNDGTGVGTFQAIVVPAPASIGVLGLAGLVATRRRR